MEHVPQLFQVAVVAVPQVLIQNPQVGIWLPDVREHVVEPIEVDSVDWHFYCEF